MFKYDLGDGAELQIMQRHHAPEFLRFVEDNRAYLGEWLDWANRMHTLEDAEKFIQRGLERFAQDGLPWVLIYQDNAIAGGLLFFPVEPRIRSTELGYWLGKNAAGRGLMTRAARAVLDFVFRDLKLNRVGLIADVNNARSRATAERIGFVYEGIQRDGWRHEDHYIDVAMYSILAREWHSGRANS